MLYGCPWLWYSSAAVRRAQAESQSVGDAVILVIEPLSAAGGKSYGVGMRSPRGRNGKQRSLRKCPPVASMASAHPSLRSAPRSCGSPFC